MNFCSKCGAEVNGRFCQSCGYDTKPEITESVKETVDKLYALRTGLSYVSVKKDDYEKEKERCNEQLSNAKSKKNFSLMDLNSEKKKLKEKERIITNSQAKKQENEAKMISYGKEIDKLEKNTRLLNVIEKIFTVVRIATLPIVFVVLAILANLCFGERSIWITLSVGIGFFIVLCLFKGAFTDEAKTNEMKSNKLKEKIGNIKKENEEADKSKKVLPDIIKRIENISNNMPTLEEKVVNAEKKLKEAPLPYLIKSNNAYNALVKEYAPLLDIRDWEKLDLIIFYLETGRAETMKEALQLVDRQIQADSIVQAINNASEQICGKIEQSMYDINNTVIKCASILSLQLENISYQQNSMINEMNAMNNSLTTELQRALKSKSSVSSKALADDVHQMRIYAENEAIRRRNS